MNATFQNLFWIIINPWKNLYSFACIYFVVHIVNIWLEYTSILRKLVKTIYIEEITIYYWIIFSGTCHYHTYMYRHIPLENLKRTLDLNDMNLLSLGSSYQNYSGIFWGLSGWAKKKVRDITIVKINHCSSLFEGRKLSKLSGFLIRIIIRPKPSSREKNDLTEKTEWCSGFLDSPAF